MKNELEGMDKPQSTDRETYYVTGNGLDAKDTAVNKTRKNPCPHEDYILMGRERQ